MNTIKNGFKAVVGKSVLALVALGVSGFSAEALAVSANDIQSCHQLEYQRHVDLSGKLGGLYGIIRYLKSSKQKFLGIYDHDRKSADWLYYNWTVPAYYTEVTNVNNCLSYYNWNQTKCATQFANIYQNCASRVQYLDSVISNEQNQVNNAYHDFYSGK